VKRTSQQLAVPSIRTTEQQEREAILLITLDATTETIFLSYSNDFPLGSLSFATQTTPSDDHEFATDTTAYKKTVRMSNQSQREESEGGKKAHLQMAVHCLIAPTSRLIPLAAAAPSSLLHPAMPGTAAD
jgi:hypothetical protein